MMSFDDFDFIYDSMVKRIFGEYCDLVMSYVSEDKVKLVQDLGKPKAHSQKKRAKDGLRKLPNIQKEVFVMGCYEQLRVDLLRQIYRILGNGNNDDGDNYRKSEIFLTECIEEEKKFAVLQINELNRED